MALAKAPAFSPGLSGDFSSPEAYGLGEEIGLEMEKSSAGGIVKSFAVCGSSSSSSFCAPSSMDYNGAASFLFRAVDYEPHQEANSLINFKSGYQDFTHADGSLLSFAQHERAALHNRDDFSVWEGNLNQNFHWNHQMSPKRSVDPRPVEDFGCFETASSVTSMANSSKENHGDWLYTDATIVAASIQESGSPEAVSLKRPHMGESTQALKKQGTGNANKKPKPTSGPSKDPQSIAAKNRRERISERLKILQELVPNGSKVDLVTMLEKAISYVKFLQLQVKVLATDEFWPAQGGKVPDISQVREAIDAILSSQRDRNSSSK